MNGEKFRVIKCPVCGKEFYPAALHAFKISGDKLVCGYHCMRQYEVTHNSNRRKYGKSGKYDT